GGAAAARRSSRARRGCSSRVVARPSAVAARRAARRRGRRVFRCGSSTRGPLVALQPLGARRGHRGAARRGGWGGRAPERRAGPLDVEGGGFSGVARRQEGRWWRCSRSALVEGTPGLLVEGGGAAERRSGAPGRSTSRAAGFPVWLVDKRAVGGAAAARRSSRARRGCSSRVVARPSAVAARRAARRRGRRVFRCGSSTSGPLVALQPLGARRGHAGAARRGWWRGRAP